MQKRIFSLALGVAVFLAPVSGLWAQATSTTTVPADPTALLKAIPADATGFVALRNLRELDVDLIGMARTLGLPLGPNGMFPAPLDWVKDVAGISEGLNENDGLALVLQNCPQAESADDLAKQMVILVPCSSAEAVLNQLKVPTSQPSAVADGPAMVNLMGEPFFAAVKGQYLVASPTPEGVKTFLASTGSSILKVMAPDRVEAYKSQDLFVWFKLDRLSKRLVEDVNSALMGLMVMANPAAMDNASQAVAELNKFVEQNQEVAAGLTIDQRGITLSLYMRMKPGTELAQNIAETRAVDGSLLTGLPDEPVILAVGFGIGGQVAEKNLTQFLDQFLKPEMIGESVSPETLNALKAGIVKMVGNAEQVAFSVSNLPVGQDTGLVGFAKVAKVADSAQAMAEGEKVFGLLKEVLVAAAREEQVEGADLQKVTDAVQWRKGVEKLAGLSVDQIAIDLAQFPMLTEEDVAELKGVLGPEGLMFRVAAVDKTHVVAGFGGGPERFTKIVEGVRKGDEGLAKGAVAAVSSRLTPGARMAEGYLFVDQILAMVGAIAAQSGQPMALPIQMRNPAPVAMQVIKVGDAAQQTDIVFPVELMVSVKEAMMPLMGMLMGGGMGGGPAMDMEMDQSAPGTNPGTN